MRRLGAYTQARRPSLRGEKVAERMEKEVPAMPSDTKKPAPLDPAALAERLQTLAAKSQAAVQEFLLNRPDVANVGMGYLDLEFETVPGARGRAPRLIGSPGDRGSL